MKYFADSIVFSYSQIFFCNRRWFGYLALLSTFIIPEMGALGLLGVIISNSLALYLKFDKEKIRDGFYGFNGILFGVAASYYFQLTPFVVSLVVIFLIITFFISAVLENYLYISFNLPGLSLPFILTLYIFFIFITNFNVIYYKDLNFIDYSFTANLPDYIQYYFKSFSLILFQSSTLTGIILVIGILLFSRVMFINSIIAFAINYIFVSLIFSTPSENLIILTSFNTILTSFALGGSLVILSRKTTILMILSSIMIIVFTGFFIKFLSNYFLPVLVLPFNVVVLSTIYSLKFRQDFTDMALLYFKPGSPEENFYYHQNRESRFGNFKALFPELPFFGEWKVSQAHNGEITHKDKWKYAWDFIIEENDNQYTKLGEDVEDYFCYNVPVNATLDGEVVSVTDNIPDNEINEPNVKENWGNTIIIDHGQGLFSSISHLKPDSIKVEEGDKVKKGDVLAHCGNSGRSPVPHLHFQFQLSDKLGDKTYKFPLAYYLEKEGEKLSLNTFEYPKEDTIVSNIEIHSTIKKAFDFKLGSEFKFKCKLNDETFTENWEVKIDILNNLYIESDRNAKIFLYPEEKLFYITNFIGNNKSSLYYFYLTAIKIPMGFNKDLVWQEEYPISIVTKNIIRYLSEFFLIIKPLVSAKSIFNFKTRKTTEEDFIIESNFNAKGKALFSFYDKIGNGSLTIDNDGFIKSISFKDKQNNFTSKYDNN